MGLPTKNPSGRTYLFLDPATTSDVSACARYVHVVAKRIYLQGHVHVPMLAYGLCRRAHSASIMSMPPPPRPKQEVDAENIRVLGTIW